MIASEGPREAAPLDSEEVTHSTMFSSATQGKCLVALAAALALLRPTPLSAQCLLDGPPTLERLVQSSDLIVLGEVTGVQSAFVNRRVETTYHVRVDEHLLGSGPKEIDLTLLGGAVEDPLPVAMVFDGMVVMSEGQDVLLFLRQVDPPAPALLAPAAQPVALSAPRSLRPVMDSEGVYTVLTAPDSGERYVTRLAFSSRGAFVTPAVNSLALQAVSQQLASSQPPAPWSRSEKIALVEELAQEEAARQAARRDPRILLGDGATIPLSEVIGTPAPRPAAAEAPRVPQVDLTALRTLEDLRAEIEDILAEEGR